MSWADDEGITGYSMDDLDQDFTTDVWVTREGEMIPIVDLTDSHVKNIIRMFPEATNVWNEARKRGLIKDIY